MLHTLLLLHAGLCAALVLRLMLFRRADGAHRPYASLLAYALTVAAGSMALLQLFGLPAAAALPQALLNLVLLLALLVQRGNVVELFRSSGPRQSWLTVLLRKDRWI